MIFNVGDKVRLYGAGLSNQYGTVSTYWEGDVATVEFVYDGGLLGTVPDEFPDELHIMFSQQCELNEAPIQFDPYWIL